MPVPAASTLIRAHILITIAPKALSQVTASLEKLQAVNIEIERSAWGVFETEMYVSYDFVPVRERIRARYQKT